VYPELSVAMFGGFGLPSYPNYVEFANVEH